jgi:hypothetical protein
VTSAQAFGVTLKRNENHSSLKLNHLPNHCLSSVSDKYFLKVNIIGGEDISSILATRQKLVKTRLVDEF